MANSKKEIGVPTPIHGNSSKEFDNFFHEQCKKIERSQLRVKIATSPFIITDAYRENYDLIFKNVGKKLVKIL